MISPIGWFWFVASAVSLWFFQRGKQKQVRLISLGVFMVLAVGMINHWLPGIHNLLIYDHIHLSARSTPFTMYLNFDKSWIGLLIWVLVLSRKPNTIRANDWNDVAKTLGVLLLVMLPLSLVAGYVRWDPKLPSQTALWAANNLFLVCMAEEGFFRGFIQGGLATWKPRWKWPALVIGAIAFGLLHYKGGPLFMLLATVAGAFYGYVYMKTKRIEAPILVHFGLNLVHFLFFTYPASL